MRSGVILAGGFSTRFGDADKAFAELAGTPMIRRVADRLEPVVDELVVNCRTRQVDAVEAALAGSPLPLAVAEDPQPDQGPMAGVSTGLRAVDGEYAAVVACDMPFVSPTFVDELFERARGHDAAVGRLDDWLQTTQAVYRAPAMVDACAAALETGERKLLAPLLELDHVVVSEAEIDELASEKTFHNVNTREDLRLAAAEIRDDD